MDIGYVGYYIDNPVLLKILEKYIDCPEDAMDFYTDYGPNEDIEWPASLEALLDLLPSIMSYAFSINKEALQKDIADKKTDLLKSFRYARWNNGYLEEECNDGRDLHYTYSSRWGIVTDYARMDPCPDDDDLELMVDGWLVHESSFDELPDEKNADIETINPTLLSDDTLSDVQKLAKMHLFNGSIEIENKKFVMCGCVDSSFYSTCPIYLGTNPSEAEIISLWLKMYNSTLIDVDEHTEDGIDYLVVRFDESKEAETEQYMNAVKNAIVNGTIIISEYQLWKSLFATHKQETERLLEKLNNPEEADANEKEDDEEPWKKEKELGFWVKEGKLTCYSGNADVVIIPETITEISSKGFNNNYGMSEVCIPLTINKIEDGAFSACRIKDITVDERHHLYKSVDGVLFDKSMKRLIAYPCSRDQATYTIPEGVCEIAPHAFYASQNLIEIVFPSTLETIGENGFALCSKLKDIKLPEKLQTLGAHAFDQCRSLEHVSLPEGLMAIGPSAFYSTNLEEVIIPKSLSVIEEGAFSWIPSLVRLTIPEGVTKICDNAFSGSGLTEVVIPFSVIEMEMKAFGDSYSLKKVTIPAHLNKPSIKWMFTSGTEIIVNEG